MDKRLCEYVETVKKRHSEAECVCINIKTILPRPEGKTLIFCSYLRIFFNKDEVQWFLTDMHGMTVLKSNFPTMESSMKFFLDKMRSLNKIGGDWNWIPVNNPKNRYKKLWGGTLPLFGETEYGKMDWDMIYPKDEDAKF